MPLVAVKSLAVFPSASCRLAAANTVTVLWARAIEATHSIAKAIAKPVAKLLAPGRKSLNMAASNQRATTIETDLGSKISI